MVTTTSPKLLNAGSLARKLRVPVAWLKTEADAGRIPHLRAGKAYLFDPQAVESVLVERARTEGMEVQQ